MRNCWLALAVVFLTRLSMGFQFQSVASVGPSYYMVYYLGMAGAQPVAGGLRDLTGSPAAPVFFAAAVMAATVPALGWFRRLQTTAGV